MDASFLQAAASASDLTTYTFSSQNLGTADADRYIVVFAGARGTNAGLVVSSITVGGVTATIVGQVTNNANNLNVEACAIAAVPTGTTGDVVVTFNVGCLRASVRMYRLVDIDSPTPHDVTTINGGLSSDISDTLDVPANGVAIGGSNTANATTATWSGITEDSDAATELWASSSAHDTFVSQQIGLSITCDWATPSNAVGVFASWAPAAGGGATMPALDEGMFRGGLQLMSGGLG